MAIVERNNQSDVAGAGDGNQAGMMIGAMMQEKGWPQSLLQPAFGLGKMGDSEVI